MKVTNSIPFKWLTGVILMIPLLLQSQIIINTEKLCAYGNRGSFAGAELSFDIEKGNSDILDVDGKSIICLDKNGHTTRLLLGLDYLEEDNHTLKMRHFIHLRHNYLFQKHFRTFAFYQIQRNKSLLLKRRQLIGGGLRTMIGSPDSMKIDLGTGLMVEKEELNADKIEAGKEATSFTWRMANVMTTVWRLKSSVSWINSIYLQPDIAHFRDYRLLEESSLLFSLNDFLAVTLSFVWRHDSRPPVHLKKNDFNLVTGVVIHSKRH